MAHVPSLRDSYPFTTLTQHSTTPTSAKPALVGDPGHVLGYDCVALRASMAQSQVSTPHPTSPLRVTSGYMVFGWGISHLPTKIPALGRRLVPQVRPSVGLTLDQCTRHLESLGLVPASSSLRSAQVIVQKTDANLGHQASLRSG